MREENIALMKRGFEAFAKADLDTIRAMSAPDCVWLTPGTAQMKPEYKGIDDVVGYLTSLVTLTDGTFRTEPESFTADDRNRVYVLEHITGERLGRTLDTHVIHVFEVEFDKVVRTTEYASEPKKLEEFWS